MTRAEIEFSHRLIAPIPDCSEAEESLIRRLSRFNRMTVLSFLNANAVMLASRNLAFLDAIVSSDYLLRDGVGCELLMRAVGRKPGPNMNGTDFIPQLVNALHGRNFALYGSTKHYLDIAAGRLAESGFTIVDRHDGFRDFDFYIERITQIHPDVVILGMGMPKQEMLAMKLQQVLGDMPILVINGGAIIDFWAGRFPRAPAWMRRHRLEWLYRFSREPRRLYRRYVIDGMQFLCLVIRLVWQSRRY